MDNNIENVYTKLQNLRCEIQKEKIKKSGLNKFSGFDYFELGDFLPLANRLMKSEKLTPVFSILGENAFLEIVNQEDKEDKITFSIPIAEAQVKGCTPIQCMGAINTYCKRYLYINALELIENDVLDPQVGSENLISKKPDNVFSDIPKSYNCSNCAKEISQAEYAYSIKNFKKALCRECQKTEKENLKNANN